MKILLAIDDSEFSEAAIQAVIRQGRPEKDEVCALHVVEPLLLAAEFRPANLEGLEASEQQLRQRGAELVAQAQQQLQKAGFKAGTAVREGDHRAEIIDHAAEWGADLIVLGSHGRKGLNRMLMGSVAEFVARHAACSVEIVRMAGTKEAPQPKKRGR
jgi:nucleotide-binding universal stress UspA family protein